jgi:hypothetical protein
VGMVRAEEKGAVEEGAVEGREGREGRVGGIGTALERREERVGGQDIGANVLATHSRQPPTRDSLRLGSAARLG